MRGNKIIYKRTIQMLFQCKIRRYMLILLNVIFKGRLAESMSLDSDGDFLKLKCL